LDDPHDEQQAIQAITNPAVYDKVMSGIYQGHDNGFNPGGD